MNSVDKKYIYLFNRIIRFIAFKVLYYCCKNYIHVHLLLNTVLELLYFYKFTVFHFMELLLIICT